MNSLHSINLVLLMSIITIFIRIIPFIIFNKDNTPKYIGYLGKTLPYAIMGMLIVYCLKTVNLVVFPYGAPEIISCIIVVLLHIWRRNALISIGVGTILYMFLLQVVF